MSCVHQPNLTSLPGGPGAAMQAGIVLSAGGWCGPAWVSSCIAIHQLGSPQEAPQADGILWRRHRDREGNQTASQSWVCYSVHCFFLYGGNPRASMRSNGKNLRPKLLDDTSSWSWESGPSFWSGFCCSSPQTRCPVSVLLLSVVGRAWVILSGLKRLL